MNSKIRFAKVDMSIEIKLANKYVITKNPTVRMFIDGKIINLYGLNEPTSILRGINQIYQNSQNTPAIPVFKNILSLTASNFYRAVNKYEKILVVFCKNF